MARQKVKKKAKIFFMILLGVLCGIIAFKVFVDSNNDLKNIVNKNEVIVEPKEEKEKVYELSLAMVGDNLLHSGVYRDASRNANNNGYDFKPMITKIKSIVEPYDLAYYNQETILGGSELGLSDYPRFNSPYEAGDAMIDAGFNLVSLATNHTYDRGEEAVLNSRKYWNSKKDILVAGSYSSLEERNNPDIRKKNNISYTMLNYTYGTNGIPVPSDKGYYVNVWTTENKDKYEAYKEQIKEDIDRVRDKVDILIVAMHWGVEYTHTPTSYEEDMASYLESLGVDIIIGTHPHVIQPVTWINDTIVFYSLGNFISAQEKDMNYMKMVGLLSSLKVTKTEKDGESSIKISDISNELIFTYYDSSWRNFKVVPFSDSEIGTYLSNYKTVYDNYKKVVQSMDNSMNVTPCFE